MYEIGQKYNMPGDEQFKQCEIAGRPISEPKMSQNDKVIFGCQRGLVGETLYVCDGGLKEMQQLYDNYSGIPGTKINWYIRTFV